MLSASNIYFLSFLSTVLICLQLCIWHCVITGIMAISAASLKSWETTITFFSCVCGFILGLPMTTEVRTLIHCYIVICILCCLHLYVHKHCGTQWYRILLNKSQTLRIKMKE